jgi:hypothetical protein
VGEHEEDSYVVRSEDISNVWLLSGAVVGTAISNLSEDPGFVHFEPVFMLVESALARQKIVIEGRVKLVVAHNREYWF